MNLRDLNERRALLITEMRALTEKPAGNGDLSAEQSAQFDKLKAEAEGIEKRIERQRALDDLERRAQGQQIAGSGDNRLDEELRNFSLRRAIASQVPDLAQKIDAGRERELSNEIAKRAGRPFQGIAVPMSVFQMEQRTLTSGNVSPDFGGANLIGTDHRGDLLIDVLRAKLVTRRLGARVLSGLVGNVDIPKQTAAASGSWISEDTELGDSDATFSKVQLELKTAGSKSEFSRNMLLQSSPDIEQLIRLDQAAVLAHTLDIAALNGAGGNAPTGILNAGISTVSGALSWAKVLEMIETLEENNVEGTGWAMTPSIKRLLRSTAKVSSTDSVMLMQENDSLAGYPALTSTNVPGNLGSPATSDALIFGNWSDLLIGFWSELDILVNPYESSAYKRGNVSVRALMSCDVVLRHTESFVALTSVDAG